jgi:hypothetical protein
LEVEIMPNEYDPDYYAAPFKDAINAEWEAAQNPDTPETEMTYMMKAVSDKLNAVLDIFAGEHVALDTPVMPGTFSEVFIDPSIRR